MVQVIDAPGGFGQQLAKQLGAGLGSGLSQASQLGLQHMMEQMKMDRRQKLIDQIEGVRGKMPSRDEQENQYLQLLGQMPSDEGEFTEGGSQRRESDIASQLWGRETGDQESPNFGSNSINGNRQEEDPFRKSRSYAAIGEHDLSRVASEEAKLLEKRKMAQEEREFLPKKHFIEHEAKRTSEFIDKIHRTEEELPNTEFNIRMLEDAAMDAGKWAAFRDQLAEKTGYEGFRSASGAELQSAIKNYFLSDLSTIKGGRPNQLIEKQLLDAYPKAGRDPISNQKVILGMKMKESIQRLQTDTANELKDKFLEKNGYLPSNFEDMVKKIVRSKVGDIEKTAIKSLDNLSKIEKQRDKLFRSQLKSGEYLMMSPEGEPFAVPFKEVSKYREEGYIPLGSK